jgi:hypothetical protein
MEDRRTTRISPQDAPAEAVERVAKLRIAPEHGDVVITREPAGWSNTVSMWRYALTIDDSPDSARQFARYSSAAVEGEQLAQRRRSRLLYVEDGTVALLMDYRAN